MNYNVTWYQKISKFQEILSISFCVTKVLVITSAPSQTGFLNVILDEKITRLKYQAYIILERINT